MAVEYPDRGLPIVPRATLWLIQPEGEPNLSETWASALDWEHGVLKPLPSKTSSWQLADSADGSIGHHSDRRPDDIEDHHAKLSSSEFSDQISDRETDIEVAANTQRITRTET